MWFWSLVGLFFLPSVFLKQIHLTCKSGDRPFCGTYQVKDNLWSGEEVFEMIKDNRVFQILKDSNTDEYCVSLRQRIKLCGKQSSDVLVKVKGKLVPPYPLCHPNQYRESLHKLAQSQIDTFFCAHVPPTKRADIDFEHVMDNAPRKPKNHWHSSKNRIKKKLFNQTNEH